MFTHAFVSDYDNFNTAWSGGDQIRLSFDRAVDHGRKLKSGGKKYVDSLFGFTHRLGDSYSGEWTNPNPNPSPSPSPNPTPNTSPNP